METPTVNNGRKKQSMGVYKILSIARTEVELSRVTIKQNHDVTPTRLIGHEVDRS